MTADDGYQEVTDFVLTVHTVEPYGLFDTIIVFHGDDEQGRTWRVGVDHRPARAIRSYVENGETIDCEVESWQLLGEVTP